MRLRSSWFLCIEYLRLNPERFINFYSDDSWLNYVNRLLSYVNTVSLVHGPTM